MDFYNLKVIELLCILMIVSWPLISFVQSKISCSSILQVPYVHNRFQAVFQWHSLNHFNKHILSRLTLTSRTPTTHIKPRDNEERFLQYLYQLIRLSKPWWYILIQWFMSTFFFLSLTTNMEHKKTKSRTKLSTRSMWSETNMRDTTLS